MEGTVIEAKDAVKKAFEYYVNLLELKDPQSVRVEEIELLEEKGGQYWLITLSRPTGFTGGLAEALGQRGEREYKLFKVLAQSGKVLSMKIRQI